MEIEQGTEQGTEQVTGQQAGGPERVQLLFVEEPIRVTVDMALLTWGDLLEIQRMQRMAGQAAEDDVEAAVEQASGLLSDLVSKITGQEARLLPAMVVSQIVAAIKDRAAGVQAKN